LRVAIVHDWLYGGGAELVVEQLHVMFPDAPIYTSYCSREWRERLDGKVRTGYLQHWPFSAMRKFIPFLRILWFSSLRFDDYDLVISSSGAEAKGIRVGDQRRNWLSKLYHKLFNREGRAAQPSSAPDATKSDDATASSPNYQLPTPNYLSGRRPLHINYCHAPTHYYWSRYGQYMIHPGFGDFDWLARLGLKLLVGPLRRWDYRAAQRPDYIIANSTHIQQEIKKYYDRDSTVIFPPIDVERFAQAHAEGERRGFLIAGRQTPYKRFDLAVEACSKLNLPLTVLGHGPDQPRLRKPAGKSVTFLGYVSDEVKVEEFARARALIFPGLDDFGITPLEAMAAGTPVVAYKAGGALDYIQEGTNGVFFDEPTVKSLATALGQFERMSVDPIVVRQTTAKFSDDKFRARMTDFIRSKLPATPANQ
jgi:glycosyltransferase involved in cell wall biosynthesis